MQPIRGTLLIHLVFINKDLEKWQNKLKAVAKDQEDHKKIMNSSFGSKTER